jgi:VIT1/CCC1 family predicted Fe2+/Mn2+ transporter
MVRVMVVLLRFFFVYADMSKPELWHLPVRNTSAGVAAAATTGVAADSTGVAAASGAAAAP